MFVTIENKDADSIMFDGLYAKYIPTQTVRQPINDGVDGRGVVLVGGSMFVLITDKNVSSVMFEGSHPFMQNIFQHRH